MGLTKDYLRFVPGPVFGVIGNPSGNVLLNSARNPKADLIAVGACENVIFWNSRTCLKEFELHGDKQAVTTITQNGKMTHLAAGYYDGTIRIFDLRTGNCEVTFSGHKTLVACLAYDAEGFQLASGGLDTEIVVWDVWEQEGFCRLKGHNGAITQCHFLNQKNVLISCSKDCTVRFWDLDTQHCFKTFVNDKNEIFDLLVLRDYRMFVASSSDEIRVYDISSVDDDNEQVCSPAKRLKTNEQMEDFHAGETSSYESYIRCVEYGQIIIKDVKKRISFSADKSGRIFGYHTFRKNLNLFKVLTSEEIKKKIHRAKKKVKKLSKAEGRDLEEDEIEIPVTIDTEIDALKPITFQQHIISVACEVDMHDVAKLVVLFKDNSICSYTLDIKETNAVVVPQKSIFLLGHRSRVATLTFSSDNLRILSASGECVKIWNRDSQTYICTLECESAMCSVFTAGNNHCLIGTRTGKIQIFEIGSCLLLESIDAHNGLVQCMCSFPDQRGVVTGGNDKEVKFWGLELIKDEEYNQTKKRLTLSLQRTLKMQEEVLCVKCSPNNKMLAVSLLDCTVQVLFADSLRLAFSLYGHKLPVRCMDISEDNSLVVTGSDDRNVKLWSMEFGNCNKSIFAHDVAVSCVQFLPKSHMFFSAGKDNKVKQWDGDKFQKIVTLEGHQNVIDALTISPDGATVVTASRDRSIRLWEKTDEILVLEEEQEMEREAEMDKDTAEAAGTAIPGEYNKDVTLASRNTAEATKAVDQLIEAIKVYRGETQRHAEYENQCKIKKDLPPLPPHPLFVAFSVEKPMHFMQDALRRIKPSDLEETLLLLPFSYAVQLLEILADLLDLQWDTEYLCKCALFLMRIHFMQLTSSPKLHPLLGRLRNMQKEIAEIKEIAGFVLSALQFLQRKVEEEENPLFLDLTKRKVRKKKKVLPVLKSV